MSIIAAGKGRTALRFAIPVNAFKIMFIGMQSKYVTTTPKRPDVKPTIIVSALNIPETFFFDAPIARRIPISFVLS